MIEYIILLLAIPLGLFARHLTMEEKPLYNKYFSLIIPLVFILAVIFAFLNRTSFLTLTFVFLMLVAWNR